jgi:hypothetical protein
MMSEAKWPEAQQRVDGDLKRLDKETGEIKAAMKAQGQILHNRINDVTQEVNDMKIELVGEVKAMAAVTKDLSDNVKAGRSRWVAMVRTSVF